MNRFALLLHAQQLPTAGVVCEAHFASAGLLVLEGAAVSLRVPTASITVSVGGFDDDTLFLNWTDTAVRYSALPVNLAAQKALLANAPAHLHPALKKGQGTVGYHRVKWNTVLASIALLCSAVVLAWWQSDALTAWLAQQVPLSTEKRLGETVLAQARASSTLTQNGAAAEAVKRIGERLTKGSRYQYQWYVKDDKSVNAYAVPGGLVVVHSGLLAKVDTAEELAGVLAHEVQHVEQRHSLQQLIHTAGWAAVLAVTLGDVSAITGVLIHQMGNLRHSRKLESEADRLGMLALARAGIPLNGMTRLFKKLNEEHKDEPGGIAIALFSSHPAGPERLAALENLARSTPCKGCKPLPYDRKAVLAAVKTLAEAEPSKRRK